MADSDITIICPNGRQLLCHRAVLASRSKRLQAVFASGEYRGQHLPVSGVDSGALEAVVSSFYSGECPVSMDTVVSVHDAASKLEVTDLLQSCMNYLQQMISTENCCTLLAVAQQMKDVQIVDFCCQFIHARFAELINCPDFHKQPFDVATSILLDGSTSGQPLMTVLHVAAAWLCRQPNRDSAKMPLLNSIGVPSSSLSMLDEIMARYSMMQAAPNGGAPTLALGGGSGMHGMQDMHPGRVSVGNLVMPNNMGQRESMNGARLLNMQPGMGMGGGGLESPLGTGMMAMNMSGGGMGGPGYMPGQQRMYPGMQPMGYDQQAMYNPQMMNGMGADMGHMQMLHMNNGMQQGAAGPKGDARKLGTKSGTSPAGRGGKGGRGGRRGGRGKAANGTGNLGLSGEVPSDDDHSEATRSMPTNEQSDGERTSSAQGTSAELAKQQAAAGAGDGSAGANGQRTSWFGGMDGVLALAEAAEKAEQKGEPQHGEADGNATLQAELKSEGDDAAAKRKAEDADGAGDAKRQRGDGVDSSGADGDAGKGQQGDGSQGDADAVPGSLDASLMQLQALSASGGMGMMPNPEAAQQLINTATQLLSNGSLFGNNGVLGNSHLSSLTGLSGLGNSWDSLTHNLTNNYPGALDPSSAANFLASMGLAGGVEGLAASLPQTGSLLESVTSAGGGGLLKGDTHAALQHLMGGGSGMTSGGKTASKLIDQHGNELPLPPADTKPREKGKRQSQQPIKGFCHVDNCNADLTGLRDYHQRYKICDHHLKAPSIMRDGVPQRFCQQCGRFHLLEAFDGTRRSCRAMLQRHNARRNKRNPDAVALPPADGTRAQASYLQSLHALQAAASPAGGLDPASLTGRTDLLAGLQGLMGGLLPEAGTANT